MKLKANIPERKDDLVLLIIAMILQLAIFLVVVGSIYRLQWLTAFTGVIVLILTFTPAMIERQFSIRLPIEFTLVTCLFLYASFGLGEVSHFYQKFWWWDLMLHSISSLVMGLTGFLLIYVFHMTQRIKIAPVYVGMISFGFAVTIGTLWESFEFAMDWFFNFNMQKSGLVDTMTDLLVNIAGGLLAGVLGYTYVTRR